MNEEKAAKPVSTVKSGPGTSAPATPAPPAHRPRTVVLTACALVLSGALAVGASLSLFGLHSFLVHSVTKSQPKPPISTGQIAEQSNGINTFVTSQLKPGSTLTSSAIETDANRVQDHLTGQLPKRNLTSSQIKDQGKDAHDAVTKTLRPLRSAPLTSTQVQQASQQISTSVSKSLTDLKKSQKKPLTPSKIQDQANRTPISQLIASVVLLVALSFVAFSVWRGRYWARWGVLGIWVLCSFTGTLAGINSVFAIFASVPNAFKIPSGLAGILAICAVVLAMMRPSVEYFALSRPTPPADAPVRRGLFAPRIPPGSTRPGRKPAGPPKAAKTPLTSSAASRGEAYVERQRSKKRATANAESIARGAELARTRAKASKSRRIEQR